MPDDRTPVITRSSSVFPASNKYAPPAYSPPAYAAGNGTSVVVPKESPKSTSKGAPKVTRTNPGYNPYGGNGGSGAAGMGKSIQDEYGTDSPKTKQRQQEQKKKDDEAAARRLAKRTAELNQASHDNIYVDGRLVQQITVYDADGNPQQLQVLGGYVQGADQQGFVGEDTSQGLAPVGLTKYQQKLAEDRESARSATYSILGIQDLQEDARFIMNTGPALDQDTLEPKTDNRQDLQMGPRGLPENQPTAHPANVTNMMTVAGGVTWFRNLSKNDPAAYAEMVDKLVGAGYIDKSDARGSAYTIRAGQGFAQAAAELSENNKAGSTDNLVTFLDKMKGDVDAAAKAAKAAAYTNVTRSYTDPTALAAQARSTAQTLLGRGLSDAEVGAFQSKFRGLEDTYYDGIDTAGRAGVGGARVVDPNAVGEAEAYARQPQFDAERGRELAGSYMDALMALIG